MILYSKQTSRCRVGDTVTSNYFWKVMAFLAIKNIKVL